MRRFKVIGINFKTAPLTVIERFVIDSAVRKEKLSEIARKLNWEELVYIATCNRVEFVFYQRGASEPPEQIESLLHTVLPGEDVHQVRNHFYFYSGSEAIHHVLRVVSSLDSMVIGENQIVGQVKRSFQEARDFGLAGHQMTLLFDAAARLAKAVFSETEIGARPTSVAYLANQFIRDFNRENPTVIFVGAGETIQLMTKYVGKLRIGRTIFVNRTLENARKLATLFGGQAMSFEEFYASRLDFDIMIVCTACKQYVITLENFERIFAPSDSKRLIIDLSLPMNVDPQVATRHRDLILHSMEDIRAMSARNNEERQAEAAKCRSIVADHVQEFERLWKEKQVEHSLKEIPLQIKTIHSAAVDHLLSKKLSHLSESDKDAIREFTRFLSNKTAQVPMRMAKDILLAQS